MTLCHKVRVGPAAPGSAFDDVVHGDDHRLAGIGAELGHDLQQRLPEGLDDSCESQTSNTWIWPSVTIADAMQRAG